MPQLKLRGGGAEAEGGVSVPKASPGTSFSGFLNPGQQRRSEAPIWAPESPASITGNYHLPQPPGSG